LEILAFGIFIVSMALTLDALEGSPKQLTKLWEGGHASISGDFGPLLELIYDVGNIVESNTI
jgi:hypothetical protein